ncbi:GLEYA adhesin domain protein [Cordyceps fumosorosea ARSEF 2679]|uniref:GLEYA adhesin domain protein n=1 Tax=Cordyceps fumosorosea (strain ARSEF 2679) TaxID=1081104 RepID=A0A167QKQ6_CORFA|nr:GLEYA adhesin domain protein [Cordyceps fumosorosea ARSEF 2679]OAA57727.1 GLEYA adhesin domain protein [Cordyceps fumosorosea ARSEF 2679]
MRSLGVAVALFLLASICPARVGPSGLRGNLETRQSGGTLAYVSGSAPPEFTYTTGNSKPDNWIALFNKGADPGNGGDKNHLGWKSAGNDARWGGDYVVDPVMALTGATANKTGVTGALDIAGYPPAIGMDQMPPAPHGSTYDYIAVQYTGCFVPHAAGRYTAYLRSDDAVWVWFGDKAKSGFSVHYADVWSATYMDQTWPLIEIKKEDVGRPVPIRIIYINAQVACVLQIDITDPNGKVVAPAFRPIDEGLFTRCQ